MSSVLEFVIRAKDSASSVVESVRSKISQFGSSLGGELLKVAGWAGAAATAVKLIGDGIREAFEVQRLTAQFETLLGSVEAAKARMAELKDFKMGAGEGLFKMPDIGKASQSLGTLTDDLIGGSDGLKMIGDAATATGNSMESVAFAVGKAFGDIKEGLPIDRAIMQLQSLGLIGPDVIKVLKDLDASQASQIEKWNALSGALEQYNGAMANMAKTDAGKMQKEKTELDETKDAVGGWFGRRMVGIAHVAGALGKASTGDVHGAIFGEDPTDKMAREQYDSELAEREKLAKDKKVADAFAKAQKEIDEKAEHERKIKADEYADKKMKEDVSEKRRISEAAQAEEAQQARENERKDKAKRSSDLREDASDAKAKVEEDAKVKATGLEEQIKALGDAAESAAKRFQTAKTWLTDFSGKPGGEWGARGDGRREWTADAAAARNTNARKETEDKQDWARMQELQGRVKRGVKLSKGDAEWLGDQQGWMKKRDEQVKGAAQAAKEQAQALMDKKALEKAKDQAALDAAASLKNIEKTLQQNLQAN